MRQKLAQGAEAVIFLEDGRIIKERQKKAYRLKEIDERLRRTRTRREAKVIGSLPVPGPKLFSVDDRAMQIEMQYLDGPRVADILESSDYSKLCREIGEKVRRLHDKGIVHGDLTTSNMLVLDEIHFIDFGLSFVSDKTEDKAVDLHVLRQALESKHHTIWQECFSQVLSGYGDRTVISRLEKVELRGRNKSKGLP